MVTRRATPQLPIFLLAAISAVAGCNSDELGPTAGDIRGIATNGPSFFFWRPWGETPRGPDAFAPEIYEHLNVRIDEVRPSGETVRTMQTFNSRTRPRLLRSTSEEGFGVAWAPMQETFTDGYTYRVVVLSGANELGHSDLEPIYVSKLRARPELWIKFRVEAPALDRDGDGLAVWDDHCPSLNDPSNPTEQVGIACGEGPCRRCPVDECANNTDDCSANAICTDTHDAFACACIAGYSGNGQSCADIDECASNNGGCHANASCTNTPGSFSCACNAGFSGNGISCSNVPSLASISPSSQIAGSGATTVTFEGANFVSGATIEAGAYSLTTTFVSATRLTAVVPAFMLANTGTLSLRVLNPAPATVPSSALSLAINNPMPVLSSISPSFASQGAAAFTITANGSSFVTGAQIVFNTTALNTMRLSATQLTATVPAALVATAGNFDVSVANPAPAIGPSTNNLFTVYAFDAANVVSFTSAGNSTWTVPAGVTSAQVLVVGGGGGGGRGIGGGGGGGGGVVYSNAYAVTPGQTINLTVGSGGAGGIVNGANATNGASSSFGTLTAAGGGSGALTNVGTAGASGGGGAGGSSGAGGAGTAGQGNGGSGASNGAGGCLWGGGGGGAATGGTSVASGCGGWSGNGGQGMLHNITGSSVYYGGGGGGAPYVNVTGRVGGFGGIGGGGYAGGAPSGTAAGNPGTANTGGGGGGGSYTYSGGYTYYNGGNGGSGVVIVRFCRACTLPGQPARTITFAQAGTVSWAPPAGVTSVEVLLVGGGGGGGTGRGGGGGGGGGVVYRASFAVAQGTFLNVVTGYGGAGGTITAQQTIASNPANGTNSVFSTLTANGGGGAGSTGAGNAGASGGGAAGGSSTAGGAGTAGQGTNGGSASSGAGGCVWGGGGGGAGSLGTNAASGCGAYAGNGGAGLSYSITGSALFYGAGGGGAPYTNLTNRVGGFGGSNVGGFGGGAPGLPTAGGDGTANSGSGGGGGSYSYSSSTGYTFYNGGNGGSGTVIIRY